METIAHMSTTHAIHGVVADKNIVPGLVKSLNQFNAYQDISIGLAIHGRERPTDLIPRLQRFKIKKYEYEKQLPELDSHVQWVGLAGIGQAHVHLPGMTSVTPLLPRFSQGPNSDLNSPAKVAVVIHGQLNNQTALREALLQRGYKFNGKTHDGEMIAHLLDATYQTDPVQAMQRVMGLLDGTFAMGVLFLDHPDRVFAAQHGIPLFLKNDSEKISWSTHLKLLPSQQDSTVEILTTGMLLEIHMQGYKITKPHDHPV